MDGRASNGGATTSSGGADQGGAGEIAPSDFELRRLVTSVRVQSLEILVDKTV